MIKLISDYCRFTNISIEAECEFINAYNKISSNVAVKNKICTLLDEYGKDVNKCLSVVNEIKNITNDIDVHEYTVNALAYILMIPYLKKEYEKREIPNWIFENSIKDVSYHVDYCKKIKGVWGTYTNWHEKFFSMKGFGFGRLQFIPCASYANFTFNGFTLKKGEPMIDVHIPNTKTPLSYEECEYCYKLAIGQFKEFFVNKPIVFHCSSWLLWERHKNMLKPTSNIVKFLDKYTLVEKGLFDDYSQIWRIFEIDYKGNPEELPKNSSLQKAYYDLVKRGEKVGWGTGLFIYDKSAN